MNKDELWEWLQKENEHLVSHMNEKWSAKDVVEFKRRMYEELEDGWSEVGANNAYNRIFTEMSQKKLL